MSSPKATKNAPDPLRLHAAALFSVAMIALLPFGAGGQDARLATDCRLNPHSLPCLGYDMETARRMAAEQDRQQAETAAANSAEAERRYAEEARQREASRRAPVPPGEYGPQVFQHGPWLIFCRRDKLTDKADCVMSTALRSDADRAEIGKLYVDLFAADIALSLSLDRGGELEPRFRLDRQPARSFDACSGSRCLAYFPRQGAAIEALRQAERFFARSSSGRDLYAVLGFLPEALAELELQHARWGIAPPQRPAPPQRTTASGRSAPSEPAARSPAASTASKSGASGSRIGAWHIIRLQDAMTDLVTEAAANLAIRADGSRDAHRYFAMSCDSEGGHPLVFISLPMGESPKRRSEVWPLVYLVTARVDKRPAIDLLALPTENGGVSIAWITPELLDALAGKQQRPPPGSAVNMQDLTAPNGAAELISELQGGRDLRIRIETMVGRLDLRFDLTGYDAARRHLRACLPGLTPPTAKETGAKEAPK